MTHAEKLARGLFTVRDGFRGGVTYAIVESAVAPFDPSARYRTHAAAERAVDHYSAPIAAVVNRAIEEERVRWVRAALRHGADQYLVQSVLNIWSEQVDHLYAAIKGGATDAEIAAALRRAGARGT